MVEQSVMNRIVRDVLSTRGVNANMVSAKPLSNGWRVILKDIGGTIFAVELPAGPPSAIRAAMEFWADSV
jgi:hypothetical protein